MVELIVTEKPMAALKIATALGDAKPIKKTKGKLWAGVQLDIYLG